MIEEQKQQSYIREKLDCSSRDRKRMVVEIYQVVPSSSRTLNESEVVSTAKFAGV